MGFPAAILQFHLVFLEVWTEICIRYTSMPVDVLCDMPHYCPEVSSQRLGVCSHKNPWSVIICLYFVQINVCKPVDVYSHFFMVCLGLFLMFLQISHQEGVCGAGADPHGCKTPQSVGCPRQAPLCPLGRCDSLSLH